MTDPAPVLVIGHTPDLALGTLTRAAVHSGARLRVVRPCQGEALPPVEHVRGAIVLGGPQSAHATDVPYLDAEKSFIAAAHAAGLPTLAICLGSQLAAEALGGTARPGQGLEVGFIDVLAVDDAGTGLAGNYFSLHSDTMDPPVGAKVLAVSDRYVQAWRHGAVLSIQFHPDLDRDGITTVLAHETQKLTAAGVDVGPILRELETVDVSPGRRLITSWLRSLPLGASRNDPTALDPCPR